MRGRRAGKDEVERKFRDFHVWTPTAVSTWMFYSSISRLHSPYKRFFLAINSMMILLHLNSQMENWNFKRIQNADELPSQLGMFQTTNEFCKKFSEHFRFRELQIRSLALIEWNSMGRECECSVWWMEFHETNNSLITIYVCLESCAARLSVDWSDR